MLDGRVVLVTGGNHGIGREITLGLRDAGATVVVVEGPVTSRPEADAAFASAARREGPIDAVVHALIDPAALTTEVLADSDHDDWDLRCEAVLRTALWCCQAAFGVLSDRGGRIVVVTPTISLTGAAGLVPLATAVEGMRSLTKAAARQWGTHGITANCVAPPVELVAAGSGAQTEPTIGEPALGRLPHARTDVAPVVASLLADATHFVTGTTITVDGGVVMAP